MGKGLVGRFAPGGEISPRGLMVDAVWLERLFFSESAVAPLAFFLSEPGLRTKIPDCKVKLIR